MLRSGCGTLSKGLRRHARDMLAVPQSRPEVPMGERFVTRGFVGRRQADGGDVAPGGGPDGDERRRRTPPGQYLTPDFPVLSAGPTPRTPHERWSMRIEGLISEPVEWTWD